jgi:hypothetical protein
MNRAEPVVLIVLLALVLGTLAVKLTLGKYVASSMALLDCREGYYGLLSLASYSRPATMEENAEWIAVTVTDGHFLFSKPPVPAHPMVVRRKLERSGESFNVATESCAFGDKVAFKETMAKLPPAVKVAAGGQQGVQLKAVLSQ